MDNIEYNHFETGYHSLSEGIGYYINKVSQEVMDELSEPINKLKSNFTQGIPVNDNLAGEIRHEYDMRVTPKFGRHIRNTYFEIENFSGHLSKTFGSNPFGWDDRLGNVKVGASQLWINFQQKYEYNPPHVHSGIYSFVLWYQIPYSEDSEKKYSYKDGNHIDAINHGKFQFLYPQFEGPKMMVANRILNVDKSKEGYFIIFPAILSHQVFPFYSSNDYRITVAGNVLFQSENV